MGFQADGTNYSQDSTLNASHVIQLNIQESMTNFDLISRVSEEAILFRKLSLAMLVVALWI
jgi:hypothetical protein